MQHYSCQMIRTLVNRNWFRSGWRCNKKKKTRRQAKHRKGEKIPL